MSIVEDAKLAKVSNAAVSRVINLSGTVKDAYDFDSNCKVDILDFAAYTGCLIE